MNIHEFNRIVESTKNNDYFIQELRSRTLEITINRPQQANGFTIGMYLQLKDLLLSVQSNDAIDIVLLKGNGKHFSSGNDMKNFLLFDLTNPEIQEVYATELVKLLYTFTELFLDFPKVLIACCQGGTIGFIFPLLALFDQVYVTQEAFFFAPMLLFGQSLEMFASYTFPRLFGHQKSFSILVRGEKLLAKEAVQFGFASKEFKSYAEMLEYARTTCSQLEQMNQVAVKRAKKFMIQSVRQALWQANTTELNNLREVWRAKDMLAGVSVYMSNFQGKSKL